MDIQQNQALLISKYALDSQPFDEQEAGVSWADCSLRAWLNDSFYNSAFDMVEKEVVLLKKVDNSAKQSYAEKGSKDTKDRLFLLSEREADSYFSGNSSLQCHATLYAVEKKYGERGTNGMGSLGVWWLRTTHYQHQPYGIAVITSVGGVSGMIGNSGFAFVRPALWVDISR